MDNVGAAQTLLRATAQAAADAVLQPPSSSSATPSEVSTATVATATVRRVVGRARRGHVLNIFQAFDVGFLGVILVTAEKYRNLAMGLQLQSLEPGRNFNLFTMHDLSNVLFGGWGMRNFFFFG